MNILFALLFVIASALAQETANQASEAKTYTLLVAVESFANSDLTRPGATALCSKNMLALYESLPFAQITGLCKPGDATRANILSSAIQVREKAQAGDTILFYFVGLGVGGDFGEPMFLTYDSAFTANSMAETSIKVDELVASLHKDGVQLVMLLDASVNARSDLVSDDEPRTIVTAGPIASDVSGKHLSLSYSPSVGVWPEDQELFGNTLAEALNGSADADHDRAISPSEINRFMVTEINTQTGTPPGVRGDWKSAVSPILKLKQGQEMAIVLTAPRSWRPAVAPAVKRTAIIGGASMLAVSGASYALSWRVHNCLENHEQVQCYSSKDEYESLLAKRNAWMWASRATGLLGVVGVGGGIVLRPDSAQVSISARW